MKRSPQLKLIKEHPKAYGGELLKTRKGRAHGRPLDTKNTMHMVLRSSRAKGHWSFWRPRNKAHIQRLIKKFSVKYGVKIVSMANVGNHLHFQLKLQNRFTYKPFIRALSSAIAMAITGASRWNPLKQRPSDHFWDYRPFTRVVKGYRALLTLKDYITLNELEGFGFQRPQARFFMTQRGLNAVRINSG
jgi:REP-associated tyrosine transposase